MFLVVMGIDDLRREGLTVNTVAWILKNVFLPLTPLFIGAVARTIHSGSLRLDSISPTELCFSMAMLSMILTVNASKLTNLVLMKNVTILFQMGVFTSLAFFAWSVLIEVEIQDVLEQIYLAVNQEQANMVQVDNDLFSGLKKHKIMYSRLRMWSIGLALLLIPASLFTSRKYNLEDL